MYVYDNYRGHTIHVWTEVDRIVGWFWCFTIDASPVSCSHDASFQSEAMALNMGEAVARTKVDTILTH